jgi:putative nucleotidyltransferase with HDIG domain
MIINPQVPLHRLVMSLSESLDHVSLSLTNHQLRVAYISTRMARLMGYRGQELRDVFHAGALHDIGLIRAEHRMRVAATNDLEGLDWHGEVGYELLRDNEFFADAAPIIRHHHIAWNDGRGAEEHGQTVPHASHILALADYVDRHTRKGVPILHQAEDLTKRVFSGHGKAFHPDCVDAFLIISEPKVFWLDVASPRIYSVLNDEIDWPTLTIDEDAVTGIAHIFGRVADGLSPWTATHSAGVAATATALAERMHFSPREIKLMRAAGYLHDLGKISVPSEILDKPGKPTEAEWAILQGHTYYTFRILETIGGMPQVSEWAAFHHERLDGQGYPFGHSAKELTLGARIMGVADTTTALLEDRPYRKGMSDQKTIGILRKLVADGALDGDILDVLLKDFDTISEIRQEKQAAYAVKQQDIAEAFGFVTEPVKA